MMHEWWCSDNDGWCGALLIGDDDGGGGGVEVVWWICFHLLLAWMMDFIIFLREATEEAYDRRLAKTLSCLLLSQDLHTSLFWERKHWHGYRPNPVTHTRTYTHTRTNTYIERYGSLTYAGSSLLQSSLVFIIIITFLYSNYQIITEFSFSSSAHFLFISSHIKHFFYQRTLWILTIFCHYLVVIIYIYI